MSSLPLLELGFPGPLRDALVAAVLSGAKTSTTGLAEDYARDGEPLPVVGTLVQVIDSALRPVAVLEITEVRLVRLDQVDLQHVVDEGEGDTTYDGWRAGHEAFWHSDEVRAELGADFTVDDSTLLVLQRFRLVS